MAMLYLDGGDWVLWLWWVVAHVGAFALIKGVGDSRLVMALPSRARTMTRGAVVGGCLASAQYLVLRTLVPWAGAWAVMTVVGWTVGFCVGESFVRTRPRGQFVFGAIVGVAQALVLAVQAGDWTSAWLVTSCVSIGGTDTALKYAIRDRGFSVRLSVVVLGVVIGGSTGLLLVLILR